MFSTALRGAQKTVSPGAIHKGTLKNFDEKEAAGVQGKVNQLPRQDGTSSKFQKMVRASSEWSLIGMIVFVLQASSSPEKRSLNTQLC